MLSVFLFFIPLEPMSWPVFQSSVSLRTGSRLGLGRGMQRTSSKSRLHHLTARFQQILKEMSVVKWQSVTKIIHFFTLHSMSSLCFIIIPQISEVLFSLDCFEHATWPCSTYTYTCIYVCVNLSTKATLRRICCIYYSKMCLVQNLCKQVWFSQ